MLLSAVSVLVVAHPSSEVPEGLMNYPIYIYIYIIGPNYTRTAPAILNTLYISFPFSRPFPLLLIFCSSLSSYHFPLLCFSSFLILFLTSLPVLCYPRQTQCSCWNYQTSNRFVTDSNSESRTV